MQSWILFSNLKFDLILGELEMSSFKSGKNEKKISQKLCSNCFISALLWCPITRTCSHPKIFSLMDPMCLRVTQKLRTIIRLRKLRQTLKCYILSVFTYCTFTQFWTKFRFEDFTVVIFSWKSLLNEYLEKNYLHSKWHI